MSNNTNARLKRALNKGVSISQTSTVESLKDELTLKEAYLLKVYIGTGKTELRLKNTNKTVTGYFIQPINTINANLSYLPPGKLLTDTDGLNYIELTNETIVDCLLLDEAYYIIGYSNTNNSQPNNIGDLEISVGENRITINETVLSINSDNLRINGLPYEEPVFLDELDNIDDLLTYLMEQL